MFARTCARLRLRCLFGAAFCWGVLATFGVGRAAGEALAPMPAPVPATSHATAGASAAFERFYGLYVGGKKVGWMRADFRPTPTPTLQFTLQAQVAGMGRVAKVGLRECRAFDSNTGLLQAITFEQTSDAGVVRVTGVRRGANIELSHQAGGRSHASRVKVAETLADDMAMITLAAGPQGTGAQLGDSAQACHLDAASGTVVQAEMVVRQVRWMLVAGVRERVYQIETRYPALKITEQGEVDGHGKLLMTKVGGLFEARLEDEAMAKEPSAAQDILLGAVVKVPHPLANVAQAQQLQLLLGGLEDADADAVPASARQRVRKQTSGVVVNLRLEKPFAGAYLPPWQALARKRVKPPLPADAAAALLATPSVQSDAKELQAMARQAIGDARTLDVAIDRLVAAVRGHMRAEYVPAFSNALDAYFSRRGDCTEYSVLFAALCRAAGLPARPVVGVAFWPPGGGFGWHAWVEVWASGSWHQVDPTWGQAVADVTHLKLAEGGPAEQARVVMLLGKMRVQAWQVPSP